MKQIAPFLIAGMIAATPVQAENSDMSEGIDLLDEGMRLLFRGLMNEVTPAMRELEDALRDLSGYHAPEILPNGDIIIRRKQPLEPEVGENGDVEL